jgi:hypothetical protein
VRTHRSAVYIEGHLMTLLYGVAYEQVRNGKIFCNLEGKHHEVVSVVSVSNSDKKRPNDSYGLAHLRLFQMQPLDAGV